MDRSQVHELLRHPSTDEFGGVITLGAQVEYWMSSIVRPIRLEAEWIPNVSAVTLRFKSPEVITDWIRPTNVGFGLSYALPIVVAGLTMDQGGLLMIESPEAHLHPAGQSLMGRFLARVAAAGTQVLVETHSDHFLNGVRRAVAEDRSLAADDLLVHFFDRSGHPNPLSVSAVGALSDWPPGFFDQGETDLGALARAKRDA
jgi:predicted ATPase